MNCEVDKNEWLACSIICVNAVVKQIEIKECDNFWLGNNGVKYDKALGRFIEGDMMSRLIIRSIQHGKSAEE